MSTVEVDFKADLEEFREDTTINVPSPHGTLIRTYQDPAHPVGLFLWYHDDISPPGIPVDPSNARIWDDDFEIFVEYWNTPNNRWEQVKEDAYDRTQYGILFNRDWSADNLWQNENIRLTYRTIVPNSNPVSEIFKAILEYPNYDILLDVFGGPGITSANYSIPNVGAVPDDGFMSLDVNRFVWTHSSGSAWDAIKILMKDAGFPYNYRVTAEPNPLFQAGPFAYAEDIITFREVTQWSIEDYTGLMLMMERKVRQVIEEDKMATMVRVRCFDTYSPNLANRAGTRILWGPGYIGGYNFSPLHNPPIVENYLTIYRDQMVIADIKAPIAWGPTGIDNDARGVITDSNLFTHLMWKNTHAAWGNWHEWIATPVLEFDFGTDDFNLGALDIRNSNFWDIGSAGDNMSYEHIGIKVGTAQDFAIFNNCTCALPLPFRIILPAGPYTPGELIGYQVEIYSLKLVQGHLI
jgi:hypothetical protein